MQDRRDPVPVRQVIKKGLVPQIQRGKGLGKLLARRLWLCP